jgi:hypothetical protein
MRSRFDIFPFKRNVYLFSCLPIRPSPPLCSWWIPLSMLLWFPCLFPLPMNMNQNQIRSESNQYSTYSAVLLLFGGPGFLSFSCSLRFRLWLWLRHDCHVSI